MPLYTIGHSTRSSEELLGLLKAQGIEAIADVRSYPTSRHCPHFGRDQLAPFLTEKGIAYIWLGGELGGYRKKTDGLGDSSPNAGWRSASFRIYADYMLSERFTAAAAGLIELAHSVPTALLCAERHPVRCHRQLISDYFQCRGWSVIHILEPGKTAPHKLTPFAQVKDGVLTYPASPAGDGTPRIPDI